jgi:hypothetical protein
MPELLLLAMAERSAMSALKTLSTRKPALSWLT